jgi:hypothetical protein
MSQTWIRSPRNNQGAAPLKARGEAPFDSGQQGAALAIALLVLTCLGLTMARPTRAQDERHSKVPVVSKITSGANRQAFSGRVKSVDLKRELLSVGTVEGSATEFFPIKKNVSVESANGTKLKVKELTPGTNVIVYYDVKEDRRTVSDIMVLGALGGDEKPPEAKDSKDTQAKKPAPPS